MNLQTHNHAHKCQTLEWIYRHITTLTSSNQSNLSCSILLLRLCLSSGLFSDFIAKTLYAFLTSQDTHSAHLQFYCATGQLINITSITSNNLCIAISNNMNFHTIKLSLLPPWTHIGHISTHSPPRRYIEVVSFTARPPYPRRKTRFECVE